MNKLNKEQKRRILADWYENLPAKHQQKLRCELMEKMDISKSTFYNYLKGRKEIPNYLFNTGIMLFIERNNYEYKTKTDC